VGRALRASHGCAYFSLIRCRGSHKNQQQKTWRKRPDQTAEVPTWMKCEEIKEYDEIRWNKDKKEK